MTIGSFTLPDVYYEARITISKAIDASKEVIENAPLVPSFEKQFQSDAMINTIHHGTHIEGNDLTLYQTKKVLEGAEVYARARDIQEVINYRNVMDLLDELAVKRGEYEPEMLKDIHRLTVDRILTCLFATHANILTSLSSSSPHGPPSALKESSSTAP